MENGGIGRSVFGFSLIDLQRGIDKACGDMANKRVFAFGDEIWEV